MLVEVSAKYMQPPPPPPPLSITFTTLSSFFSLLSSSFFTSTTSHLYDALFSLLEVLIVHHSRFAYFLLLESFRIEPFRTEPFHSSPFHSSPFHSRPFHSRHFLQQAFRTKPMDLRRFLMMFFWCIFTIHYALSIALLIAAFLAVLLGLALVFHLGVFVPATTLGICSWMIAQYHRAGIPVPLGLIVPELASAISCVVHFAVLVFFYFKGLRYTVEALKPYIEVISWVIWVLNITSFALLRNNFNHDMSLNPIWSTLMDIKLCDDERAQYAGKIVAGCLVVLLWTITFQIVFCYLTKGLESALAASDGIYMFYDILGRYNAEGRRESDSPTPSPADYDGIELDPLFEAYPEE
jgi:small-conductance mechanosensitive channel